MYFPLVFVNSCPSPLLITGSICKSDMPFSQLIGPVYPCSSPVGITIRYLPKVCHRVTWSFIILNLLSTLSAFVQIRLHSIPRLLRSGLGKWYAAISAANSTAVPNVGGFKSILSTFVGVVLIAPVIIMYAALCRCSSLDLAKAMSIMSHYVIVVYMILWIITCLMSHNVILDENPQVLLIIVLHDHRAYRPFFTSALTCSFHVDLSSRKRYLTSFDRFNQTRKIHRNEVIFVLYKLPFIKTEKMYVYPQSVSFNGWLYGDGPKLS